MSNENIHKVTFTWEDNRTALDAEHLNELNDCINNNWDFFNTEIQSINNTKANKTDLTNYATINTVDTLTSEVRAITNSVDALESNLTNNYDTKTEVDNKFANYTDTEALTDLLDGKQDTIPANTYDTFGSADTALEDAKVYTDTEIAGLDLANTYATKTELEDINDIYSSKIDVLEQKTANISNIEDSRFILGSEDDNLTSLSKHSLITGQNINAGIRGLKIADTYSFESDGYVFVNITLTDEEFAHISEYYDFSQFDGAVKAALVLNHHSFDQFQFIFWDASQKEIKLRSINPLDYHADYYELSYEDDGETPWEYGNYLWFYKSETNGNVITFDVTINDNAPIRPEADYTYALGDGVKVYGRDSFSSGQKNQNTGWYSATMGRYNIAYYAAFALGAFNKAVGTYSVALNQSTTATGVAATSKGHLTEANGFYSEAGGQGSIADHKASFAHGYMTKTSRDHQTVIGQYNDDDDNALLIVGNGTSTESVLKSEFLVESLSTTAATIIKRTDNIIEGTLTITPYIAGAAIYHSYKIDNDKIYAQLNNGDSDETNDEFKYVGTVNYNTGEISLLAPIENWNQAFISYEYNDVSTTRTNAFIVEAVGSAILQTQGKTENSVVIKKTLTDEINATKSELNGQIDKLYNYIAHDNDYVYLETPSFNRGTRTEEQLSVENLTNGSFTNYKCTINDISKAISFTNLFTNAYDDFLLKVKMNITSVINGTNVQGAVGPFMFLFDGDLNTYSLQFRCGKNNNGTYPDGIFTQLDGATAIHKVTPNLGLKEIEDNTPKTFTFLFKFFRKEGILNIYQNDIDNLVASIVVDTSKLANSNVQLAFGGRFCTYSAEFELHKATYYKKTITREAYDSLAIKDPYTYYVIEE